MATQATSDLKQRVLRAEAERDYYVSLVDAFFSGEAPAPASLQHVILAQWGRRRHAEMSRTPALLHNPTI